MLNVIRQRAGSRRAVLALARTTAQVFFARLFGQAAGFLTAVLVARALGPEGFGIYSLALIGATLLAQLPGPGADMSAVRVSARYRAHDPDRAREALLVAALAKAAVSLALALAGAALAEPLAATFLAHPQGATALRYAALSAGAIGMTEYMLATLQAGEQFGRMLFVSLATAALKLVPVALLWAAGTLTLDNALALFVAAAYAGLLLSVLVSWHMWAGAIRHGREALRELLAFSRWLIAAMLLGALTCNLDVLALTYLAGAAPAGLYNAGRTLTLPLAFAGGALGAVLLPRLSAHTDRTGLAGAVWQITLYIAAVAAVVVAGLAMFAPLILRVVYGASYGDAVAIFQILMLAYALQLITWPALTMQMVLDRPDVVAWVIGAVLGLTAAGYLLIVPIAGTLGAAWVFLAGASVQLVAYLFLCGTLDFRCVRFFRA
ncbi:MAG TPA: lipopolysaccharide biosynthesis protein [Roseiflexaceae bacterium]|nr:lipopolysaccharide biosynthesis protein [Roseiflexaceae bacterium]